MIPLISPKELYRFFDFSKETSADENKKILIIRARNKQDRPSQKTKLGRCLSDYTKISSKNYDAEFAKNLKKTRPDWFISQSEAANDKKKKLLHMAKKKMKKPHWKTLLGYTLSNYTRKSSLVYDAEFDAEIRRIAPFWFDF